MTPADLIALRTLLGLTQDQFAQALGLTSRITIARYEAGTHPMPEAHARLVREAIILQAHRLLEALRRL